MEKPRQFNFNTFLNILALAAICWVGTTLLENNRKIGTVSERLVAMEVSNVAKVDQLNRIETEQNRQRVVLNDLQLEVVRMKTKP